MRISFQEDEIRFLLNAIESEMREQENSLSNHSGMSEEEEIDKELKKLERIKMKLTREGR